VLIPTAELLKRKLAKVTSAQFAKSGTSRAVVLVKAAPQASGSHGETVCVAALDEYGKWHRLYPVNFRDLAPEQRFGRWDNIEFKWRLPEVAKDRRIESKRIQQDSIVVLGSLKPKARQQFLERAIIDSPAVAYKDGKSLALVRPQNPRFKYRRRTPQEMDAVLKKYEEINASPSLFGTTTIVPREPAPFEFSYAYEDGDGLHDQRCHDWEVEQTFLKWRDAYGEERALRDMMRVFGEDYPRKGMVLAMGTHGQRNWQWMIIGILRLDEITQPSLL
jgi:hypothetical protein